MLIQDFLEHSAGLYPHKTALVCQDSRWTYAELEDGANRLARALLERRLERGDRVAVWLENSAEAVTAVFGIAKAGGVLVVLNPQLKARKLEYILNDCQARVLIADEQKREAWAGLPASCPALAAVVTAGPGDRPEAEAGRGPEVLPWPRLLAEHSCRRPARTSIDADLAALIYTSGSTGNPKGVMLTHLNMATASRSIITYLENTPEDVVFSCLPLSFDYGLYQALMTARFGGTLVLEKAFTYPYPLIERLIREKATGFPLVPTMAAMLLELKQLDRCDFSSLRYLTSTAQALPPSHIQGLQRIFPRARIYSMYGLTECKRVSYLPPEQLAHRPASVGKAMPNTEAYLVDEHGRRITQAGVIGELVVRGSHVMQGYWNLPRETAEKLRPGGPAGGKVLYTGDLFKQDEEGYLYFVSRKDDLIKTGGELVSPREVENILHALEGVAEASVSGREDRLLGQIVCARVVLKAGTGLTAHDILRHCQQQLEPYMIPKHIEFCQCLPKTLTGKVKKRGGDEASCAASAEA